MSHINIREVVIRLRWILVLVIILMMTFSSKGMKFLSPGYILAIIYFVSNLLLYLLPLKQFSSRAIDYILLMFDILFVSVAIYLSNGVDTDFYLVYFLTIFMSSVGQDIKGSLPVAVVISILYGWMVYRNNPNISLLDTKFLIRIPFFFVIATLSGLWSQRTKEQIRQKEELEQVNRELKIRVDDALEKERTAMGEMLKLKVYSENILKSVTSGVMAIDTEGNVNAFNPEASRVLRIEPAKIMGKAIDLFEEIKPLTDLLRETLSTGIKKERGEITLSLRDGDLVPLGFSISPIVDENSKVMGSVTIFRDLSQIRALEEKLKHSERLSYLGKMAAWVAHEIRNPLARSPDSVRLSRPQGK